MEVLEFLKSRIERDIAEIKEETFKGSSSTYEGYREQVGIGRGLMRALMHIQETEMNSREAEDNE